MKQCDPDDKLSDLIAWILHMAENEFMERRPHYCSRPAQKKPFFSFPEFRITVNGRLVPAGIIFFNCLLVRAVFKRRYSSRAGTNKMFHIKPQNISLKEVKSHLLFSKKCEITILQVLFKSWYYFKYSLSRCGYNSRACTI